MPLALAIQLACMRADLEALRLHSGKLSLDALSLLPRCAGVILGCYELQARAAKLASLQQDCIGLGSACT